MKILVVGSVAIDSVKTPSGNRPNVLGGSCTYFSYAASFFTHVDVVATVGRDFPKKHIELLRKKGIGLEGLEVREGKTFRWEGAYEGDMNQAQTLLTELNVFESFRPDVPARLRTPEILFLANIDPDLQMDVLRQVKRPKFVVCDTMNLWINVKRESLVRLFKKVDGVIVNDAEARHFLGDTYSLVRSAREISRFGPRNVIIKKGEHGALLYTRDGYFFAPPYPLETVVDPTGAGDTFAGGFLGALARGGSLTSASLRKAMVYGSCMASFTVQDFSLDRLKRLTRAQIEKRFGEFRKLMRF